MATLATQHPNADTELNFSNAYELLVATILSAQCTDERVNQVTPALFARYPNARTLARATTAELEPQIQSTGFFRAKSRSLVGMATQVVECYAGEIPRTMDDLVTLPGVGRKTANVVLGHALSVPGLPVDRHVLRVANRIGIARSDDPEVVEQQLCRAMPPAEWTRTSDTLIFHGRRICKPRPLCDRCAVREDCLFFRRALKGGRPPIGRRAAKPPGTGRGGGTSRTGGSESTPAPIGRRAAEPRGSGHRSGASRTRGSESTPAPIGRRAAKPRGSDHGSGASRTRGSESTPAPIERRAAKPRGTGRGGGAPRQTKR
jgi:endonuclease III